MTQEELIESIAKIGEVIEIQYKIKTQLEEALLASAIAEKSLWVSKDDPDITARITGIDFVMKEVIVNTTNYRGISFRYSSFLARYELIKI